MPVERFPLFHAVESERDAQRRWKLDRLARLRETIDRLQATPRLNDEAPCGETTITYPRRVRNMGSAPHR